MSELINKIYANLSYQKQFGNLVFFDKNVNVKNLKSKEVISKSDDINIKEKEIPKIVSKNSVEKDWQTSNSLEVLNSKIHNCLECELGATRKSFVFGSGNPKSKILIIGDVPDAKENELSKSSNSEARELLTKILGAINFTREDIYITNIIKCRLPEGTKAMPNEFEQCEPYLKKQIELINPEFILALGLTAVNTLLKSNYKMKDVKGKVLEYEGKKLLTTYHPSALLRNPTWKRQAWEDVQQLRAMYVDYMKLNELNRI